MLCVKLEARVTKYEWWIEDIDTVNPWIALEEALTARIKDGHSPLTDLDWQVYEQGEKEFYSLDDDLNPGYITKVKELLMAGTYRVRDTFVSDKVTELE